MSSGANPLNTPDYSIKPSRGGEEVSTTHLMNRRKSDSRGGSNGSSSRRSSHRRSSNTNNTSSSRSSSHGSRRSSTSSSNKKMSKTSDDSKSSKEKPKLSLIEEDGRATEVEGSSGHRRSSKTRRSSKNKEKEKNRLAEVNETEIIHSPSSSSRSGRHHRSSKSSKVSSSHKNPDSSKNHQSKQHGSVRLADGGNADEIRHPPHHVMTVHEQKEEWKQLLASPPGDETIKKVDIERFKKQFKQIMEHPDKAEYINWKDDSVEFGRTMLFYAIDYKRWDIANLLLGHGADINIGNKWGMTALHKASSNGQNDIVKLLLEMGADMTVVNNYGETALMWASRSGHIHTAKLLLEKGANIKTADKNGTTALALAAYGGGMDTVKLLMEKGADLSVADRWGRTALIQAADGGQTDTVKFLLDKGADVTSADKDGETSLIKASKWGHHDVVKLLVGKGADITFADKTGMTALMWASRKGHSDTVKLLLEMGEDITLADKWGRTALSLANEEGHTEIVKLLQQKTYIHQLADTNKSAWEKSHGLTKDAANKTDTRAPSDAMQKETDNPQLLDSNEDTRQKLERVMNGTADPVVLDNKYVLALHQEYLNKGAFGAVYKAQDKVRNWTFALKKVLYHLQDEEMCETVTYVFRTELAILSKARHPNIIRLFGYRVDPNKKNHILLFEYAEMGSLAMLFQSERDRMVLTASRRLQILVQTASALCFLHKGGNMESCTILHRDIKSDNICVAGSFQAKLIDCGLGKLVDDAKLPVGSFVQQSHSSAFGTDGYRCPWYSVGKRTYKPACDVYSFGIVIMEVLTGILQGGASSRQDLSVRDFRSRYLEDQEEQEEIEDGDKLLNDDADPLAGWEDDVLEGLSKLAMLACHEKTKLRPSAEDLMDELSRLIHIHELGAQLGNQVVSSVGPAGAAVCHTCARVPRVIRCSNGHGICGCCLNIQIQRRLGMATIVCPIGGCHSMPFDRAVLEQGASPKILRAYLNRQEDQKFSSNVMGARVESIRNLVMEIRKDAGFIRGDVQILKKGMSRTLQAIANQAAGTIEKCPRLVLLVPSTSTAGSFNLKSWMKNPLKRKVRVYFVCQHSITTVDNPIELEVTRQWVLKVAPALKLSLMLLKMLASTMSIPLPELPEFLGGEALVEMLVEDGPDKIKEALEGLEENG